MKRSGKKDDLVRMTIRKLSRQDPSAILILRELCNYQAVYIVVVFRERRIDSPLFKVVVKVHTCTLLQLIHIPDAI